MNGLQNEDMIQLLNNAKAKGNFMLYNFFKKMNKIIISLCIVFLLSALSGCNISGIIPDSIFESSASKLNRSAIVLQHNPIGIDVKEGSVFFDYLPDNPSNYLSDIFREIRPMEDTEGVFHWLNNSIENRAYFYPLSTGEIFASYLLTEEGVNISDESLRNILNEKYLSYVKSFKLNKRNYRFISFTDSMNDFGACSGFIQIWDDDYIWAQPIMEYSNIYIPWNEGDAAQMFLDNKGREVLILCGYKREGYSPIIICATGFVHNGDIWEPIDWNEIYEESIGIKIMKKYSDGIMYSYGLKDINYGKEKCSPIWVLDVDGTIKIVECTDANKIYEVFIPRKNK